MLCPFKGQYPHDDLSIELADFGIESAVSSTCGHVYCGHLDIIIVATFPGKNNMTVLYSRQI